MIRMALAAVVALALGACSPPPVDPADPWASLHPWNHGRSDIQKLPSGVEYVIVKRGDGKGAPPGPRDRVEVRYEGRLAQNGLIFNSSYQRGETSTFPVNGVIPGWTQGLQKMQPGDQFMFWIPSKEGYGERGQGMKIPPDSDLMFQVELIKAMADPWPGVTPWPNDSSKVMRRPSGLEYMVVESGPEDAASATDNDMVVVNFEGRLEDPAYQIGETPEEKRESSLVLSTYDEGRPKTFPVAGLTEGWKEAIKMMRPGDRWITRMPAQILYGEDSADRVPPNSTVIYEIELLAIAPPTMQGVPPQ